MRRRRRLRENHAQDASGLSPAPFTVPPPPSRTEKSRRDPDVERQASGSCTPGNMSTPPSSQDQELREVLAHMTARVQVLEEERLGGLQVTNEDPPEYTPPPGTQESARNGASGCRNYEHSQILNRGSSPRERRFAQRSQSLIDGIYVPRCIGKANWLIEAREAVRVSTIPLRVFPFAKVSIRGLGDQSEER